MRRLVLPAALVVLMAMVPAASAFAPTPATCNGLAVSISGTPGDDTLNGTAGNDVIHGGDGDDVIDGKGATTPSAAAPGPTPSRGATA